MKHKPKITDRNYRHWNGIDRENRLSSKWSVFFAENRIQLTSRNLTQRPIVLKFKQIMRTSDKKKTTKKQSKTRKAI